MKKLVNVVECEGAFESLMGKKVTFFCCNYFYTGILTGVNNENVLIENPAIVYDTGSWDKKEYSDVQSLGVKELFIQKNSIEAFGEIK